MNPARDRLLIFTKAPVPGTVKTRLRPRLSDTACAELHRALTEYTLATATKDRTLPVTIYCAPDTSHTFFRDCSERYGVALKPQTGNDLGERMAAALQSGLAAHDRVVIIGTDCPLIDIHYIRQAFDALSVHDVVLGPAADGGYVLIGARRVTQALFMGIDWGSSQVLAQTRERLATASWRYMELHPLWDIDTAADLDHALRQPPLRSLLQPFQPP